LEFHHASAALGADQIDDRRDKVRVWFSWQVSMILMLFSHCFVAQAVPKRKDKYLFEGKLWIDVDDYAVVRIVGHPAKKLSFWIERADFVRQYQKIEGFWLPEKIRHLSRCGSMVRRS
jgi:hypothetical protein